MTTPHITPDLKVTLKDIYGWCGTFHKFHLEWPKFQSTAEQFAQAGVSGISGRDIERVLRSGSNGLSDDSEYQRVHEMAMRHSYAKVDLSFIDPQIRRILPPDVRDRLISSFTRSALGAPSSEGTMYVSLPFSMGTGGRAPISQELLDYIGDLGMVYGNAPHTVASEYYLELVENGRLFIKYSTILGSRYLGDVEESAMDVLRARLARPATGSNRVLTSESKRKPATIESEIASIVASGNKLVLPQTHLAHYAEIKLRIEKACGRYVQGRQEFVFEHGIDVPDVLRRLAAGETVNFQQQYQFFSTSAEQADMMVEQLVEQLGSLKGMRILEPSAGTGALADAARRMGAEVVTVEAWNVNAIKLRAKGYEVIERDFLTISPREIGTFHAVLANPPFAKDQDIEHVKHMLQFIRPGGALSTIMSTGWQTGSTRKHVQFREFLASQDVQFTPIEAGAFKHAGTTVPTVRLDLRFAPAPADMEDPAWAEECLVAPAM